LSAHCIGEKHPGDGPKDLIGAPKSAAIVVQYGGFPTDPHG